MGYQLKVFFNTTLNSLKHKVIYKEENEFIIINCYSFFWSFFNHNGISIYNKLIYKKLIIDFINKLIPTARHTNVKVFLIKVFPFNLVK